jgi:hypothetical protein
VAVGAFTITVTFAGTFFLQPINSDGSSIFKKGQVIPVKFQLTGASSGISNAVANLYYAKLTNGILGSETEAIPNVVADSGSQFHGTGGGMYQFNLGTSSMSIGTWQLRIDLHDGVEHVVNISLKP